MPIITGIIGVKMSFFRTSDGAEVDLVLEFGGEIWAIEVKASLAPRSGDVRGLKSFMNDHKFKRAVCVCQSPRTFKENGIEFVPWQDFIKQLSVK